MNTKQPSMSNFKAFDEHGRRNFFELNQNSSHHGSTSNLAESRPDFLHVAQVNQSYGQQSYGSGGDSGLNSARIAALLRNGPFANSPYSKSPLIMQALKQHQGF